MAYENHQFACVLWGKSHSITPFKDARSVSLYPYNQSQILQYVKYTK